MAETRIALNRRNIGRILTVDAMPLVQDTAQRVADAGDNHGLHLQVSQDDRQETRAGAAVHPVLLQEMRAVGKNPSVLVACLMEARRG